MKQVMQKAQELADAIVASEVYRKMKDLEEALQNDEAAAEAVNDMARKRQKVEELLTEKGMDPEELKMANQEMIQAEKKMNANPKVAELKNARKSFSSMMDNVNRVLRLVITGEIREDDFQGGCGGNCSGCSGCS
jgi:cell fate (sporulation/competence/biofilm development) regulator YlbF (YheA/YmcA/DUF963 family)